MIKMTGDIIQVCVPRVCRLLAFFIRKPQLVSGSWMPMPRKLRNASDKMTLGICKVNTTMMWLNELGYRCLKMMRRSEAPISLAARIKSVSRKDITLPRTSRASKVQPSKAKIQDMMTKTRSEDQVGGMRAARAIHRGSAGKDWTNSMKRCSTLSTQPP